MRTTTRPWLRLGLLAAVIGCAAGCTSSYVRGLGALRGYHDGGRRPRICSDGVAIRWQQVGALPDHVWQPDLSPELVALQREDAGCGDDAGAVVLEYRFHERYGGDEAVYPLAPVLVVSAIPLCLPPLRWIGACAITGAMVPDYTWWEVEVEARLRDGRGVLWEGSVHVVEDCERTPSCRDVAPARATLMLAEAVEEAVHELAALPIAE